MTYKGKTRCKILKEIRKQIAAANDIKLVIKECTYQGDCTGTCPHCEAEVSFLERELARRQAMGKAVVITGFAASALIGAPAFSFAQQPTTCSTLANKNQQDLLEEEEIMGMVFERMPEFPGGAMALFNFLKENVHYPQEAKEKGHYGRAICQFVVDKDGSITEVVVVRSAGDESLDAEALRVLNSMPRWKPGEQRGKPIRTKYTVPINFMLTTDVKGKVVDLDGAPIVGALVKVVGNTKQEAITDNDGAFEMTIEAKYDSIDVSAIGYDTQRVQYKSEIVIVLTKEVTTLMGPVEIVPKHKATRHRRKRPSSTN